eukprot:c49801_g1_i1 orf=3-203(-)
MILFFSIELLEYRKLCAQLYNLWGFALCLFWIPSTPLLFAISFSFRCNTLHYDSYCLDKELQPVGIV